MADEIYAVEVKKRFRTAVGGVLRWVERPVSDVIPEKDSLEYRCKDCHGKVRLHSKNIPHGPAPHAEHMSRQDSECPSGIYFREKIQGASQESQ